MKVYLSQWKAPVALCYLFSATAFAQTESEVRAIRNQTDTKALRMFGAHLSKKTLSKEQLRKKAKSLNIPFRSEVDGKIIELQAFDKEGKPIYYSTQNAGAAFTLGTNQLTNESGVFNLQGEGMKVHEWDGGAIYPEHKDFGGRAKQVDKPSSSSDHATHVAGTLIGNGAGNREAQGMAPKAMLNAYDWTSDLAEMSDAAENGALVSNHSYGLLGGFEYNRLSGKLGWHWLGDDGDTEYKKYGWYSQLDGLWDYLSKISPYFLPVKAAGNPRGDGPREGEKHFVYILEGGKGKWIESEKPRYKNCGRTGYDCLVNGSLAKNILMVGASYKIEKGYEQPSDVKAAVFSAFGPTDDGRIKPDLVSAGVSILSTSNAGPAEYSVKSGTSMATPAVTGSLILLQELYKKKGFGTPEAPYMKAATLKALAIHTTNEAGDYLGPDYKFGYGLFSASNAAQTLATKDIYSLIKENELANGITQTVKVTASGTEPLKVTIVWDDPSPAVYPKLELNNRLPLLVNDLDIRVSDGTDTFYPWTLNPETPDAAAKQADNRVDNVEQIVIQNPVAGKEYTITVSHKGQLKENPAEGDTRYMQLVDSTKQDYSMIVSGLKANITKDLSLLTLDVPDEKSFTENTNISAKIQNLGTDSMQKSVLQYKLINVDDNRKVVQQGQVDIPTLEAGKDIIVQFDLDLSQPNINYTIDAEIISKEDLVPENNKRFVGVFGTVADLTKPNTSYAFGFEDTLKKRGWTTEDLDGNGRTWIKYTQQDLARSGSAIATNFPNRSKGSDDWLYSNPIRVKAGTMYSYQVFFTKFQKGKETLSVHYGDDATYTAMTNLLTAEQEAEPGYRRLTGEFTPTKDGIIYIGFHNKMPADQSSYAVAIDDFIVKTALGKPYVNFSATTTEPNTYEGVVLINDTNTASTQPATYKWVITPETFRFVEDGEGKLTNSSSASPVVVFEQEGTYNIALTAKNEAGEDSEVKNSYITAKNIPTIARFFARDLDIYERETASFTNLSRGNPAPTEFNWTVTPSDGVEFLDNTNLTTPNLRVRFNDKGKYEVQLTAKSVHNTHKSGVATINVKGVYEPVRNLTSELQNGNVAVLDWERPIMNPIYVEQFPLIQQLPADMTVIDNNNDKETWYNASINQARDNFAAVNFSNKNYAPNGADDVLITGKIHKGPELLRFNSFHSKEERYDVYIVPATGNQSPSYEEVMKGHKIYSYDLGQKTSDAYLQNEFDVSKYTTNDFFVAFHHRTLPTDNGHILYIDDIELAYKNSIPVRPSTNEAPYEENVNDKIISTQSQLSSDFDSKVSEKMNKASQEIKEFGILDLPRLMAYEVVREGEVVKYTSDLHETHFSEKLANEGIYTYEVTALYTNGGRSRKRIIILDAKTLATEDAKATGLKIYPNPSNGKFVIELPQHHKAFSADVFDASGRKIFAQEYKSNLADIDLTAYSKGVYILSLSYKDGSKQSVKLIIN